MKAAQRGRRAIRIPARVSHRANPQAVGVVIDGLAGIGFGGVELAAVALHSFVLVGRDEALAGQVSGIAGLDAGLCISTARASNEVRTKTALADNDLEDVDREDGGLGVHSGSDGDALRRAVAGIGALLRLTSLI
jgi:hypothetical protein